MASPAAAGAMRASWVPREQEHCPGSPELGEALWLGASAAQLGGGVSCGIQAAVRAFKPSRSSPRLPVV